MVASPVATGELDNEPSEGLLFGSPQGIEMLRLRGHLPLMDSTHGTNWLGWFLYTIMVRDEGGSWLPCAHFLAQKEDGDIVATCLKLLKQWLTTTPLCSTTINTPLCSSILSLCP